MRSHCLGQLAGPTALTVAQLLKQPLKVHVKVCEGEIESDIEKTAACVSENTSVQLSVLEWKMINLSKGLHRGGKPNLGSVTD